MAKFRLTRTRDLDHDLGSGDTAYRHASLIDLYLIESEETFCGQTNRRMDRRTSETHFIRSTWSRSNNI